jgi:hypothetical protein
VLLILTRDIFGPDATLGRLAIEYADLAHDGRRWVTNRNPGRALHYCYVCEDEDRGLDAADPTSLARKVRTDTAIPVGEYEVRITPSPKYGRDMMRLIAVPAYEGVLIHAGNDEADTAGCLLPGLGRDAERMTVSRSTVAVDWIFARVRECAARGEAVRIRIERDPEAWARAPGRAA